MKFGALSALREQLIEGYKSGRLLHVVSDLIENDRDLDVTNELSLLHNEGIINAVEAFSTLNNNQAHLDFFLVRNVFENVLPKINSPVLPVMNCVRHLYLQAGNDLAAGSIYNSFVKFCANDNTRPPEVLKIAEGQPEIFADFIALAITAGSSSESQRYVTEAIRLSNSSNIDLRRRGLFSLGRVQNLDLALAEYIVKELEQHASNETDDTCLATIVRSSFAIFQKQKSLSERTNIVIRIALSKGDENTIHAASELFGLYFRELPEELIDVLIESVRKVKPQNLGTLRQIDRGIDDLLKRPDAAKGIALLESLLLDNATKLSIKNFDGSSRVIGSRVPLLNKVCTRWFLKGNKVLCEGVREILSHFHNKEPLISVDCAELSQNDPVHIIFLARKCIGYLFITPTAVASFIVSLMRIAPEKETLTTLKMLLTEHILLNHPNITGDFIVPLAQKEEGAIKAELDDSVKAIDNYLKNLRSIGEIFELAPSEKHRETYMRRFTSLMAASMKEAESKSTLLNLFTRTTLLYGRKAIHRVYCPDGASQRVENELQNYSTTMAIPRVEMIDPVGFDYTMRVFRVEQFKS